MIHVRPMLVTEAVHVLTLIFKQNSKTLECTMRSQVMSEEFRAQLPGIPPVDGEKMSRPERQHYSHEAEKAAPFVLTQEDNRVLIEVQGKHRVQIEIKY